MALPALGLDPGSVLGLLLIQLLLLLPPEATTTMTTPGISGQEPIPRVKYHIGKWPVAGRCGESNIGREIGDGCRDMCVLREGGGHGQQQKFKPRRDHLMPQTKERDKESRHMVPTLQPSKAGDFSLSPLMSLLLNWAVPTPNCFHNSLPDTPKSRSILEAHL